MLKMRKNSQNKHSEYSYLAGQSFLKLHSLSNTQGTEYKTRNQVQIFSAIKCIEISEVTLTIHIDHPFITP